jgi:IMP dehydrogenase
MPNPAMQEFFERRKGLALTFDDVLLTGARARHMLSDVSLRTHFSRNVPLLVPIVGAAMSSVVGIKMAIALAKVGGIGSIPRSLDPVEQAKAVAKVKHHIHGFIDEPITTDAETSVAALLERIKSKGYEFDSFPVLDKAGRLVGLITHNDFKRCDDPSQLVGSVMTSFGILVTAAEGISVRDAYQKLKKSDKNVLPVMRKDGTLAGIYTFSDLNRIINQKTTHNVDQSGRLRVAAAVGAGPEALERAELLAAKNVDAFHIDMANGWQNFVFDTAKQLKAKYPNGPDVVIGNFAIGRAVTEALEETNADGVLVGIGGGSICTTRTIIGTGVPQVTAVYDCAKAAQPFDVPVCSDGGIRQSGDIAIALAAGADSVMVGGLIAGTDESPGDKRVENGQYVKDYYGMGSLRAMKESSAARHRYLQGMGALIPEGIEGSKQYKGPVNDEIALHVGGLKKSLHANGARTIAELHENADFNQVTAAGQRESHPHDVTVIKQAPNYSGRV